MIQENLELISELLQNRNANWLAAAILALIAVYVALFLAELFLLQ